ncbi:MAG: thermonuclease family protein, partial [Mycobacterium sp.]
MSTPEERVLARLAGGEAREPSPDGYQVVDADTVETPEGRRLRLDGGVDAPETEKVLGGEHKPGDPGGDAATRVMARLLQQPGATHETTGTGAYGRDIGRVTLSSGQDAGEYLASVGAGDTNRWSDQGMLAAERSLSGAQAAPDLVSGARQRDMAEIADARKHTQFDPYASARMPRSRGNAFTKGVARGTDQMQASLYAGANALGEFLGVDAMAEWGEQGMVRNMLEAAENPAEITDLDDIDSLSKFGTFAAETLGEFLPQAATMLVPGGGAAMIAKAGIGKALLTRAAAKMGTSTAGLAGRAGATGGAYVQGVGEVQMGLKDEGIDAPGTALAFGVPIAAADMIGLEATFLKAFKGSDTGLGDNLVRGVIQEAVKRGLIGSGTEASTEAMQTLIEKSAVAYNDPEYDLFSPENIEEIKFAAAKGGVGGGATGSASSVAGSTYRALSTEDQDHGQVTPPEDSPEAAPESAVDEPQPADPVADAAEPVGNGLDAIRPVPDAPGQLDAQVEELRDPASTRDSVLSTTGEDFSTPPADGEVDIQTDHGTFRTNSPEQAARIEQEQAAGTFAEPQARDEVTGEILFNNREGGKNLEATQAVVNERPDGTRTTEILTDDANVDADLQRAADMGREGDTRRVVPAEEVLEKRQLAQNETEQGVAPVHAHTEAPVRDEYAEFLAGEPESSPTGNRLNLAEESAGRPGGMLHEFGIADPTALKTSTILKKLTRRQKEQLREKHAVRTFREAVELERAGGAKPGDSRIAQDVQEADAALVGGYIRERAQDGGKPSDILDELREKGL